jgi:hypothetical protein
MARVRDPRFIDDPENPYTDAAQRRAEIVVLGRRGHKEYTLARRGEQEVRVEPKLQRRAGLLERGAHGRVQMVAAKLAGISALSLDAEPLRRALAREAFEALPKPDFKQMVQAAFVIGKLLEERANGLGLAHVLVYAGLFYVCKGDKCLAPIGHRIRPLRGVDMGDGRIPDGMPMASMTMPFDCHFAQRSADRAIPERPLMQAPARRATDFSEPAIMAGAGGRARTDTPCGTGF